MRNSLMTALLGGAVVLTACRSTDAVGLGPSPDAPTVLTLSPVNATVGVDATKPVVITFTRGMMVGMESMIVIHEGSITGPQVPGLFTWSGDRTVLTFTPAAPLKAHTAYAVHMSPSLTSTGGQLINLAACAQLGGQYATSTMMGIAAGSGMMNGGWGPGMMGDGWRSANGTFGMVFTFTTS